jgi:cyclopropane fatty-acyl-phospholipid synthase-like methyltransferase
LKSGIGFEVMDALQDIYDEFARTYEANRGLFDMTDVFASFYARFEGRTGRLLDLGCGAGDAWDRLFVERGWSVTGVDFSRRMLELAAKHVPEMQTVHADMRQVEFPSCRFDAITAIYSLFHLARRDQALMFVKFSRWLIPGGTALFTYATRDYTGSDEFDGYKEFLGRQLYYSHTTPAGLYAELEQAGLNIEAAENRDIGNESFLWVTVSKPTKKE